MTQGRIPEEEELKLYQGADRVDGQGCVSPHPGLYFHTPWGALTHKSLIDEILSKVNQDQGDDVPQQALEESEDASGWVGKGHWPQTGQAAATSPTLNTVHLS